MTAPVYQNYEVVGSDPFRQAMNAAGNILLASGVTLAQMQAIAGGSPSISTAIVAAAGSSQGTAAAITANKNIVTGANGTTAILLPTATATSVIEAVNTSTTAVLNIYPGSGASINSGSANAVFTIGPGRTATFIGTSATQWYASVQASATPTLAEVNLLHNTPAAVVITNGVGGSSNICFVNFQVNNAAGSAIAVPVNIDIWLSDASTGAGLTATTASGTVANSGGGGADFGTYTAKKALRSQTSAAGLYQLSITDTAKTGFYPCCQLGNIGMPTVGAQLTTGSYHA